MAEGGLTKTKMILGWESKYQRLLISLPKNKLIAWTTGISQVLVERSTTSKQLESIIGQLGHLTLIMPSVHHFLRRLRKLQQPATHRRLLCISKTCQDNLLLMLHFLDIAKKGIDMNLVAFCQPTHIYQSDSCPFGLGGYSDKGFACHFKIPEDLRFRASNNLLKYVASTVSPWVNMLAGHLKHGNCALSMTDSSTSAGWLKIIHFREVIGKHMDLVQAKVCIKMAGHHATLFLNAGIKEYSQWLPEQENNLADALSCDFDRSDNALAQILCKTCPTQLPQHFQIAPLPHKVSSWLTSCLEPFQLT